MPKHLLVRLQLSKFLPLFYSSYKPSMERTVSTRKKRSGCTSCCGRRVSVAGAWAATRGWAAAAPTLGPGASHGPRAQVPGTV